MTAITVYRPRVIAEVSPSAFFRNHQPQKTYRVCHKKVARLRRVSRLACCAKDKTWPIKYTTLRRYDLGVSNTLPGEISTGWGKKNYRIGADFMRVRSRVRKRSVITLSRRNKRRRPRPRSDCSFGALIIVGIAVQLKPSIAIPRQHRNSLLSRDTSADKHIMPL